MSNLKMKKLALLSLGLWLGLFFTALALPASARAASIPDRVVLDNLPYYYQQRNLSCEYAAAHTITLFWNKPVSEGDFINAIGYNANPHIGFRGNIDGPFGGTRDYGIYAEPIARALSEKGFQTKLLAGGADALKQELALGRPVQVWTIAGLGWGSPFQTQIDGATVTLVAGEHSMVIYGYDQNGVYISDPSGGHYQASWGSFLRSWSYFNYMALSFWPDSPEAQQGGTTGISPYFYAYWLNHGDIPILGLPLENAKTENGKVVQYFERARLEWNPKSPSNQVVTAGLLGRELTASRSQEQPFKPVTASTDSNTLYFPQTGHTVANGFRTFWENNGGLQVFGYPISQEFDEGGKVVQYFERARLEYHLENPEPTKILLGLLGVERLYQQNH
ncbi:MAG TPA: C39 family peptidase [Chloroflexia bacterium]|nr:C39 family peptidase [Chloroflexia bacterium]